MFMVIVGVLHVFICDEMEIVPKKKAIRNGMPRAVTDLTRVKQSCTPSHFCDVKISIFPLDTAPC